MHIVKHVEIYRSFLISKYRTTSTKSRICCNIKQMPTLYRPLEPLIPEKQHNL